MLTSINRITTHPIDTDLLDRLGINSSSKVANPKVGGAPSFHIIKSPDMRDMGDVLYEEEVK